MPFDSECAGRPESVCLQRTGFLFRTLAALLGIWSTTRLVADTSHGRGHRVRIVASLLIAGLAQILGGPTVLAIQETPLPGTAANRPSASDEVEFSPLDTFYLRNEAGELIPFFKFTFEEWEKMYLQQEEGEAPLTSSTGVRYQLLDAQFQGKVDSDQQVASLRMTVRVQANDTGDIELPLGLANWALAGAVESSKSVQLSRERDRSLRLAFQATKGEEIQVTLPLLARLKPVGQTTQLDLSFPHAVPTQFQLVIDKDELSIVDRGVVGLKRDSGQEATTITIDELSETAQLSWREVTDDSRRFRTKAQLSTRTSLECLTINRWQASCAFQLSPLGQPITELLLAAPPNSSDFAVVQNGVRLKEMDWQEAKGYTAFISDSLKERRFLHLGFLRPITEDTEITVSFLVDSSTEVDSNAPAELTYEGIHAFDCVFISGTVEATNSQRELDTTHVTSTGINLSRTPSQQKDTRQFEVSRQDYRLTLTTRRRPAQVSISPVYTLFLNPDTELAMMTVTLSGSVQGQFSDTIAVPLKQWVHKEKEGLVFDEGQLLLNPAIRMDLNSNNFSFDFVVDQRIDGSEVDLELPVPVSSASVVVEPAKLTVVSVAENREFLLDKTASTFEATQKEKGEYRSKTGTDVFRLKGMIQLKPRVVEMEQQVEVLLSKDAIDLPGSTGRNVEVRQTIQLDIRNQSLPRLWFLTSNFSDRGAVRLNGRVVAHRRDEVQIDGSTWTVIEPKLLAQELRGSLMFEFSDWAVEAEGPGSGGSRKTTESGESSENWLVSIAQPMLDPVLDLQSIDSRDALIRLIQQQTETFSIFRRSLQTPLDPTTQYQLDDRWVPDASIPTSAFQSWIAFGAWPTQATLKVKEVASDTDLLLVEHVEVQTWWEKDRRLDRVIASLKTDRDRLEIRLPPDAGFEQLLIDGVPALENLDRDEERVFAPLPDDDGIGQDESIIVELWLSRSVSANWWYRANANPPLFPNWQWCQDFRWRVFVDGSWECVSWSPLFSPLDTDASSLTPASVSTLTGNSRERFQQYLQQTSTGAPQASLLLGASQLRSEDSLLLVNRYWLRMTVISLMFLSVLLGWWTGLFRSFYFWAVLGFFLALVYASSPRLFYQVTPMIVFSFLAAMAVLVVDSLGRRKPRIFAEMDTFVGSTRTVTGGPNSSSGNQVDSGRLLDGGSHRSSSGEESNGK